jgi:SSS family solute:Na+ symporter
MAVNMYSAWWSFVVCVSVTIVVSLFTKRKPEAELKDLVLGLTTLPEQKPCPWHQKPLFWAAVVTAALIAVNIIFW